MAPPDRYTGTLYVVHDGAIALHEHGRLGTWLPPGGHVDAGEAPHEAALREAREETGLPVSLVHDGDGVATDAADPLPEPRHVHRIDLAALPGAIDHTVVDFVYYARTEHRDVSPGEGEVPCDRWEWFTPTDLRENRDRITDDVFEYGRRAIRTVGSE